MYPLTTDGCLVFFSSSSLGFFDFLTSARENSSSTVEGSMVTLVSNSPRNDFDQSAELLLASLWDTFTQFSFFIGFAGLCLRAASNLVNLATLMMAPRDAPGGGGGGGAPGIPGKGGGGGAPGNPGGGGGAPGIPGGGGGGGAPEIPGGGGGGGAPGIPGGGGGGGAPGSAGGGGGGGAPGSAGGGGGGGPPGSAGGGGGGGAPGSAGGGGGGGPLLDVASAWSCIAVLIFSSPTIAILSPCTSGFSMSTAC